MDHIILENSVRRFTLGCVSVAISLLKAKTQGADAWVVPGGERTRTRFAVRIRTGLRGKPGAPPPRRGARREGRWGGARPRLHRAGRAPRGDGMSLLPWDIGPRHTSEKRSGITATTP